MCIRDSIYLAIDSERAKTDIAYGKSTSEFHSLLRDLGYKVIEKKVKWYISESGEKISKSNADLEMAVDVLLQSEKLDRVALVTGDGDFVQVVKSLQNRGCQVEIIGVKNVSSNLRKEADQFFSGYLIPNLIPTNQVSVEDIPWGVVGSRVRGVCFKYLHDKGYGFMRFLKKIDPKLWLIDTRNPESPYEAVFFHESFLGDTGIKLPSLPNRDIIFEFELAEDDKRKLRASNIEVTYQY